MSKDFLLELGTEELPPKSLNKLMTALVVAMESQLRLAGLQHTAIKGYATPRRLAVLVTALDTQQPATQSERLGPAVSAAFGEDGVATPAAEGFARSCGVTVAELETSNTPKGKRLAFRQVETGRPTIDLLPDIVERSLAELPIERRMRWGASRTEFVRPVHWLLMIFGKEVAPGTVLGLAAGNISYGHRFHRPGPVAISSAGKYAEFLRQAYVVADFSERRELIRNSVTEVATRQGGSAVIDEDLLSEVTALVEWPVVLPGRFDERFLAVPSEALISSMKEHQKYFHVVDKKGALIPVFITVANIDSRDPDRIIAGNERVILPRLADAEFFYQTDLKTPLVQQREKLRQVVFQEKLGSIYDKTERVALLARTLAPHCGADPELAGQAAELAKSDLVSEMVNEFETLQGVMGAHYARAEGLDPALGNALAEQYLPRFSGDVLPQSPIGKTLAIADRIDTLVGIFAIGERPTGSSDPFALRRASLAVLRILVEHEIDLDLLYLLRQSAAQYQDMVDSIDSIPKQVLTYMLERFHSWYVEEGVATNVVLAVLASDLSNPLDISTRIRAVADFTQHPESSALAAANKRVANILDKQSSNNTGAELNRSLLVAEAEQALAGRLADLSLETDKLVQEGCYAQALTQLASLQEPVDRFFDDVMVMVDDTALRNNRLALLWLLRKQFLQIADISLLAVSH